MDLFVSEEALGGRGMSRRQMRAEIERLYDKLDRETERREELLVELRRADREIERWTSLLQELGEQA